MKSASLGIFNKPTPETEITTYRILSLIGIVAFPVFALVYQGAGKGVTDPLWFRLVGVLPLALTLVSSYVVSFVRKHYTLFTYANMFIITSFGTYVGYVNGFRDDYLFGTFHLIFVMVACIRDIRFAVTYVFVSFALFMLGYYWVGNSSLSLVVSSLLVLLLVVMVSLRTRNALDAELAYKTELLTLMFEQLNDAVLLVDPETKLIVDCNRRAVEIFEAPSREAMIDFELRTLNRDFLPPEVREKMYHDIATGFWEGELRYDTFRGNRIMTDANMQRIRVKDKALTLVRYTDITSRYAAQQAQNELLQQLRHANEELNEFAHVVSHDLKAPLRNITSLLGVVRRKSAVTTTLAAVDFELEMVQENSYKLGRLVEDVLHYAQIGHTRDHLASDVAIDTETLVREILVLLQVPPHIRVTVDPLPPVMGERVLLWQLFQNLLANAIKYNDKTEGWVHISHTADAHTHTFAIADNGKGIEATYFEKIFKIFQRLDTSDSESTGIGLAIVDKIVRLHKGSIRLESLPNEGTTFYITLPQHEIANYG